MYDVASADEVWPSACIEPGDFSTVNANALGCLEEITCVLHLTIEPLQDNLKGVARINNNVDLEITNVIGGRLSDLLIVTGNNRYSRRAYPLVAGMAPGPDSHNWHTSLYTSGAVHGHDNYSHNHPKKSRLALHHLAYELHDNLDSGSVNWSALGWHKIPAHPA